MPARSLPAVGSDTAYVALTRGKRAAFLYTDDPEALREAAGRDRQKANATELFPEPPVAARARFVTRLRQIAGKVAERVRQLTPLTHKETDHAHER